MSDFKRVMELTENQVIDMIESKITKEELLWMRIDGGEVYLIERYGEIKALEIKKKTEFWYWWRQVWHLNDKNILSFAKGNKMPLDLYLDYQYQKLNKFNIHSKLATIIA